MATATIFNWDVYLVEYKYSLDPNFNGLPYGNQIINNGTNVINESLTPYVYNHDYNEVRQSWTRLINGAWDVDGVERYDAKLSATGDLAIVGATCYVQESETSLLVGTLISEPDPYTPTSEIQVTGRMYLQTEEMTMYTFQTQGPYIETLQGTDAEYSGGPNYDRWYVKGAEVVANPVISITTPASSDLKTPFNYTIAGTVADNNNTNVDLYFTFEGAAEVKFQTLLASGDPTPFSTTIIFNETDNTFYLNGIKVSGTLAYNYYHNITVWAQDTSGLKSELKNISVEIIETEVVPELTLITNSNNSLNNPYQLDVKGSVIDKNNDIVDMYVNINNFQDVKVATVNASSVATNFNTPISFETSDKSFYLNTTKISGVLNYGTPYDIKVWAQDQTGLKSLIKTISVTLNETAPDLTLTTTNMELNVPYDYNVAGSVFDKNGGNIDVYMNIYGYQDVKLQTLAVSNVVANFNSTLTFNASDKSFYLNGIKVSGALNYNASYTVDFWSQDSSGLKSTINTLTVLLKENPPEINLTTSTSTVVEAPYNYTIKGNIIDVNGGDIDTYINIDNYQDIKLQTTNVSPGTLVDFEKQITFATADKSLYYNGTKISRTLDYNKPYSLTVWHKDASGLSSTLKTLTVTFRLPILLTVENWTQSILTNSRYYSIKGSTAGANPGDTLNVKFQINNYNIINFETYTYNTQAINFEIPLSIKDFIVYLNNKDQVSTKLLEETPYQIKVWVENQLGEVTPVKTINFSIEKQEILLLTAETPSPYTIDTSFSYNLRGFASKRTNNSLKFKLKINNNIIELIPSSVTGTEARFDENLVFSNKKLYLGNQPITEELRPLEVYEVRIWADNIDGVQSNIQILNFTVANISIPTVEMKIDNIELSENAQTSFIGKLSNLYKNGNFRFKAIIDDSEVTLFSVSNGNSTEFEFDKKFLYSKNTLYIDYSLVKILFNPEQDIKVWVENDFGIKSTQTTLSMKMKDDYSTIVSISLVVDDRDLSGVNLKSQEKFNNILINWEDPKENNWAYSKIVKNYSRMPTDPSDGILVDTVTIKNKYQTRYLIDQFEEGITTVYYKVFTFNIVDKYYSQSSNEFKLDKNDDIDPPLILEQIKAVIDSKNVIHLTWEDTNEDDLMGVYIVTKKNSAPQNIEDGLLVAKIVNTTNNSYTVYDWENYQLELNDKIYIGIFPFDIMQNINTDARNIVYVQVNSPDRFILRNFMYEKHIEGISFRWTDPDDLSWIGTKVIRKEQNFSDNISDGAVVLDNQERNAYQDSAFLDSITNLEYEKTYYYSFFAYDELGNFAKVHEVETYYTLNDMNIGDALINEVYKSGNKFYVKFNDTIIYDWEKTYLTFKVGLPPMNQNDGTTILFEERNKYKNEFGEFWNPYENANTGIYFRLFTQRANDKIEVSAPKIAQNLKTTKTSLDFSVASTLEYFQDNMNWITDIDVYLKSTTSYSHKNAGQYIVHNKKKLARDEKMNILRTSKSIVDENFISLNVDSPFGGFINLEFIAFIESYEDFIIYQNGLPIIQSNGKNPHFEIYNNVKLKTGLNVFDFVYNPRNKNVDSNAVYITKIDIYEYNIF